MHAETSRDLSPTRLTEPLHHVHHCDSIHVYLVDLCGQVEAEDAV